MSIRQKKIARLLKSEKNSLRTLDLFAGCGGMSLGFDRAGYELMAAIEYDQHAAATHGANFFSHLSPEHRKAHSIPRDITETDPRDFIESFYPDAPAEESIDVIIGGPPCQAFSIVGRAKLREIMEHPEAFKQDKRAHLYEYFLNYVEDLQPLAILMENVPEILRFGGDNIAEKISEKLDDLGYNAKYTVLNSVFYGVPQLRDRMFLVAFAKELNIREPEFPTPTHKHQLPQGYKSLRKNLSRTLENPLFPNRFITPPHPSKKVKKKAVTVEDALRDLPPFTRHLEGKLTRGVKRLDEYMPYAEEIKPTFYGKLMRTWPGFKNKEKGVYDHMIRLLRRDYPIFRMMKPGDQYPAAHHIAETIIFQQKLDAYARDNDGKVLTEDDEEYQVIRKKTVPPYDPTKFANKWRKLDADEPSRTLTAHIGKDTYSHIHYDSDQARTISVREAARLQSFPDAFKFEGTLDPALKQIGNAVPPLLSYALAESIKGQIDLALNSEDSNGSTEEKGHLQEVC